MRPNLLVFAQDPGSAACMTPVLGSLVAEGLPAEFRCIFHPDAEPVLTRSGGTTGSDVPPGSWPIQPESWRRYFESRHVTHVWCTLSSRYRDMSNSHLIEAARSAGVPTLGLMDHWKGYDRFYDEDGRGRYFPDYIGCIDEHSLEEFRRRDIQDDRLCVVGQPVLEMALKQRSRRPVADRMRVLVVSQPNAADRSFEGVFLQHRHEGRLIDGIVAGLAAGSSVFYRSHPKEVRAGDLPAGVTMDSTPDTATAVQDYDLMIGLDSMMLVEAALMGSSVVILDLPELDGQSDVAIPYAYGHRVSRVEDLAALDNLQERPGVAPADVESLIASIEGSLDRSMRFVRDYLAPSPATGAGHA